MRAVSARRAVAGAVADYRAAVEAETLRLFRLHLQVTVRRASPLALDIARHEGIDLVERLEALRPSPRWLASPALSDVPGVDAGSRTGTLGRASSHFLRDAYANSLAFADHDRADGPLSFDVALGSLQVCGKVGVCGLHTVRSRGRVTLPSNMPDTLIEAARGRELDAVVDHPAIRGRGYVVRDVAPSLFASGPVLLFETGLVRFEMPWRDMLLEELAAARCAEWRMRSGPSAAPILGGHG